MSHELATLSHSEIDDHGLDEIACAAHAEALLVEMDGTTAELFSESVRSRRYAVLVGLTKAYSRCVSSSTRAKTLEGIMSVRGYVCVSDESRQLGRMCASAEPRMLPGWCIVNAMLSLSTPLLTTTFDLNMCRGPGVCCGTGVLSATHLLMSTCPR
jgi:hypothetical protein